MEGRWKALREMTDFGLLVGFVDRKNTVEQRQLCTLAF